MRVPLRIAAAAWACLLVCPAPLDAALSERGGTGVWEVQSAESQRPARLELGFYTSYQRLGLGDSVRTRLNEWIGGANAVFGLPGGFEISGAVPFYNAWASVGAAAAPGTDELAPKLGDVSARLRWSGPFLLAGLRWGFEGEGVFATGNRRETGYGGREPTRVFTAGHPHYTGRAMMTWDGLRAGSGVPLRLHGNAAYTIQGDDTRYLLPYTPLPLELPAPARNADNDYLTAGAAIELDLPRLTLFGEAVTQQFVHQRGVLLGRESRAVITPGVRLWLPGGLSIGGAYSLNVSSDDPATAFDPARAFPKHQWRAALSFGTVYRGRRARAEDLQAQAQMAERPAPHAASHRVREEPRPVREDVAAAAPDTVAMEGEAAGQDGAPAPIAAAREPAPAVADTLAGRAAVRDSIAVERLRREREIMARRGVQEAPAQRDTAPAKAPVPIPATDGIAVAAPSGMPETLSAALAAERARTAMLEDRALRAEAERVALLERMVAMLEARATRAEAERIALTERLITAVARSAPNAPRDTASAAARGAVVAPDLDEPRHAEAMALLRSIEAQQRALAWGAPQAASPAAPPAAVVVAPPPQAPDATLAAWVAALEARLAAAEARVARANPPSVTPPTTAPAPDTGAAPEIFERLRAIERSLAERETDRAVPAAVAEPALDAAGEARARLDEAMPRGVARVYPEIVFATGRTDLDATGVARIEALAELIRAVPEALVQVVGHTDSRGPANHNLRLSRARAATVATRLAARGVEPDQLFVEGRGDTDPLADNRTAEGRGINRRVEFVRIR